MGPFELAVRKFTEETVPIRENNFIRGLIAQLSVKLYARSPVKSGRFRSNWFYSVDASTEETTTWTNKTAVNNLQNVPKDAFFHNHYITNNLPYAWRLENGWSKQAPIGVVGITVAEFNIIVGEVASSLDSLGSLGVAT